MEGNINGIRKKLSALAEIKRCDRKTQNMKRNRLLRKYNTEKKENLDQVIEELKQRISAKLQWLFRYGKRPPPPQKKSTIKIKCSEHTARNFTTFSGRQIPK
jgi:hypothetical protein